jgi:hypothetical protein
MSARLIYFDAMQPGEVLSCAQALEMFVPVTLLFFAAADTVMRRLAAGTLLEGTCRVAEETWFLLVQEDVLKRTPGQTLSEAALMATFCGYEVLLGAGEFTPTMLHAVSQDVVTMTQQQQQSTCMSLMAAALDCFLHPRAGTFSVSSLLS